MLTVTGVQHTLSEKASRTVGEGLAKSWRRSEDDEWDQLGRE